LPFTLNYVAVSQTLPLIVLPGQTRGYLRNGSIQGMPFPEVKVPKRAKTAGNDDVGGDLRQSRP
jgi:hypothetical protein